MSIGHSVMLPAIAYNSSLPFCLNVFSLILTAYPSEFLACSTSLGLYDTVKWQLLNFSVGFYQKPHFWQTGSAVLAKCAVGKL